MATQSPRPLKRSRTMSTPPNRRHSLAPAPLALPQRQNSTSFVDVLKQLNLREMKNNVPSIWKHELGALREDCTSIIGTSQEAYHKNHAQIVSHLEVATKLYSSKRKETDHKFHTILVHIRVVVDLLKQFMDAMFEIAPRYDFIDENDEPVIGNGYRTLVYSSERCLLACLRDLQDFAKARSSRNYNSSKHYKHLTSLYRLLLSKVLLVEQVLRIENYSEEGCLFAERDKVPEQFMEQLTSLPIEAFYGRYMGLQYSNLLRPLLNMIVVAMATYYDCKNTSCDGFLQQAASTMVYGGQYLLGDPEVRAKKVSEISLESDIKFTKSFWSISESISVRQVMGMLGHPAALSEEICIPAKVLEYEGEGGQKVVLTPPFQGTGYEPLRARLISYLWREGQERSSNLLTRKPSQYTKATGLIIHFHGGGFVAQSSKSHELYLRSWSEHLNVPILSVDYTLAPESTYPRALDEAVFAYAWALMNLHRLGTTGERVVIAGDSAGGNLSLVASLKLVRLGIRPPDSICVAYPCTYIDLVPSPSRLLSVMDPVLPLGIILSCLCAYTGKERVAVKRDRESQRRAILEMSNFREELNLDSNIFLFEGSHPLIDKPASTSRPPVPPAPCSDRALSDEDLCNRDTDSFQSIDMTSLTESFQLSDFNDLPETDSISSCGTLTESLSEVRSKKVPPPRPPLPTARPLSPPDESFHCLDVIVPEKREKPIYFSVQHLASELGKPYMSLKKTAASSGVDSSDYISSSSDDERAIALIEQSEREDGFHSCDEDSGSEEELNNLEELLCNQCRKVVSSLRDKAPGGGSIDTLFNPNPPTSPPTLPDTMADPFLSPFLCTADMVKGLPPINIYASALDPLLDDSVEFAKKLKAFGHPVSLSISQNLPHGFLSMALSEKTGPGEANERFMQYLRQALISDQD